MPLFFVLKISKITDTLKLVDERFSGWKFENNFQTSALRKAILRLSEIGIGHGRKADNAVAP
jgi:hypothetical protein